MLVAALATGIAAAVVSPVVWWPHIAVDVMLVGYLAYLRRQVRMEEAIRARRAARMAGTRRPSAADDPELDEWAERGRDATRPAELDDEPDWSDEEPPAAESAAAETPEDAPAAAAASDTPPAVPSPALSTETTSPASSETRAVAVVPAPPEEERPALPRLRQTPLPRFPRARRWSTTRKTTWISTTAPPRATVVRSASRRLLGSHCFSRSIGAVAQLVARLVRIE